MTTQPVGFFERSVYIIMFNVTECCIIEVTVIVVITVLLINFIILLQLFDFV